MLRGTTKTGFQFEIPEENLDNMELIDALSEADQGNKLAVSRVCELLLGKSLKKALYDHVRISDGRVPTEALSSEILDIIMYKGESGKN